VLYSAISLSSGNSSVNGLSVATGLTAAAALVIGAIVLVRGRGSAASILFFIINVVAGGWLGCFATMYAAPDPVSALGWARAGFLFTAFLAPGLFHFAVENVAPRRILTTIAWIGWPVYGVIGLVAVSTNLFITRVHQYPWGYYPIVSARTTAFVAVCAAAIVPGVLLLWRSYRRGEGEARERSGALLLACVLGCLGFIDLLPAAGVDVYPAGYMSMFAFVLIAAAALTRYRLVDLTPQYAASQLLDTMKSSVLVVDLDGTIRVTNKGTTRMLAYAPEDLIGAHIRKILDPDENTSTRRILGSSGVLEQTMVWRNAEGARVDVLASSSFVRDADGAPVGIVYVASDYTERKRAEQAVRESEHRYRMLFDLNPIPMWAYDFQTLQFIAVNDAAVRHYGYTREEFLEMKITDIRPQEDVAEVLALLPLLAQSVGPNTFRHMKKDGSIIDVEISSFEFMLAARSTRLVIARDVTEGRRNEQRLRDSEARYRLLFERNLAGVYRTTTDGRILDCNDAFARIFGYTSREEMLDQTATSLYFDNSDRERALTLVRDQKTVSNFEARMRRRDNTAVWVLENMTLLDGDPAVLEGTVIDITDRKYAQEQIEYHAYHDLLTGLPNRLLFRDRITVALAHARRSNRTLAVMFFDLDEFKAVNDKLGHTVGDRLLQAVAMRLVNAVRAEDTVARMGGDEFTVLLADVGDGRGAATVARKIIEAIGQTILVDGHEIRVTTSIGLALFPGDGFDAETLLKSADRAMYRAKQLGRNNYQYATPPPFDDRYALQRRLKQALERQEFVLHYQPIAEITTGRVVGAEALVRWNDPARGLLPPDSFIHVAEESDLIMAIGEWVLRTACAQMKRWHDAGHNALRVSVNLSPRQFQYGDLPAMVARVLADTRLPAAALDLEITESTAMHNAAQSLITMVALKDMGVRISIDDLGTGYSSLSYLKRFPIDTLKIDQEFVRDVSEDANDRAIIAAVVSMARALKLRVIAEGVETQEQLAFLKREACAEMQGFLHSRPVAPEEFESNILKGSRIVDQGSGPVPPIPDSRTLTPDPC
jgi:diguanylate cyclase (GGDEF)-like protein/PAS domain S-box-containing protein